MISLSRLDITGDIDSNTPKCVIEEICHASSIKFDKDKDSKSYLHRILSKIYRAAPICVSSNYKEKHEELRLIARFVNPDHIWEKEALDIALHFLLSFKEDENCERETFIFDVGPQTSISPKSLNACVLFRLCKYSKINVKYSTGINEMASHLRLFYLLKRKCRNNHIITTLTKSVIFDSLKFDAKEHDLVNILNYIDSSFSTDVTSRFIFESSKELLAFEETKKPEVSFEYDSYETEIYNYENLSRLASEIIDGIKKSPKNYSEAIVMGALYHKIDLSRCRNPVIEYYLLNSSPYFPYDSEMKRRLKIESIHPETILSPYLDKVFNPRLPSELYSSEDLTQLCYEEGIEFNTEIEDRYTALQIAYLTETFVHGKEGGILNITNTFLEEFSEVDYDDVVVYGSRTDGKMIFFTYGELFDTFSTSKKFLNPQKKEIFSKESIRKLQYLCQKERRDSENEDQYEERSKLGDEIDRLLMIQNNKNEIIESFLTLYHVLDDQQKMETKDILFELLNLSMYMRNWDGKGNYPLTSEETNYEHNSQIVIDDRVTQSLIQFDSKTKKFEFGEIILNLPLIQYIKGSNTFTVNNEENEGLTISDRLKIVRTGEEDNTLNSCIRLSSNRLCATAYYYLVLIGAHLPFNIRDVSYIY